MKQRERQRYIKKRFDKKGNLLCLIPTCNNKREKYKTTDNYRNYCKDHSGSDMSRFTNWQSLRYFVLKRDNYTCKKCGDKNEYVKIKKYYPKVADGFYEETISNFVVDHITPIAIGGDEWDINNLQTLCLNCNKIKTKQDAKKIAKQRNIEKNLKGGQQKL